MIGSRRVAGALLASVVALGCPGSPSTPKEGAPAREAAGRASSTVREYTARGEVVRLPQAGAPVREITVRHEAIPGFVGQGGQVVGMPAMVMSLALAPGVSLEGLRPGDKVEFLLAVDWERGSYVVRSLRTLPADTALRLDAGR